MSSPDVRAQANARATSRAVRPLLDAAVGLFVWAAHLLVIYIATAVACQLGLGASGARARTAFQAALVVVTVVALAIVALHAYRRYRGHAPQGAGVEPQFRTGLTVGCDAIAAIAIAGQLLALLLVPLCP